MSDVLLTLDEVHQLVVDALRANGCNSENAAAVADTIRAAERDNCASHGIFRLPGYIASLQSGKVNGAASPVVRQLSPGVIQADGGGGFAPLALQQSRSALAEAARKNGIAALALINVHHFAALWAEVEPLAASGLVTMAFTTYKPAVVPFGAKDPLYGTNPMCFGWPRGDKPPMVFDQASAAMARGEVMIAARDGEMLPPGVGIDSDGLPTTNPSEILDGGALLAFGGHKGSAIALMIELLVAGLTGQDFSFEAAVTDNNDGGPPNGGELMLAIDPSRFGDSEGWLAHAETLFEKLNVMEGARLPGDRRYSSREENEANGISIPASLHETCKGFLT